MPPFMSISNRFYLPQMRNLNHDHYVNLCLHAMFLSQVPTLVGGQAVVNYLRPQQACTKGVAILFTGNLC